MIPACSAVWRAGRGGVRWEKWRLGELVYWFPEPPSSLLPPLLRGATSHTPHSTQTWTHWLTDSAPTNWLLSCQVTTQTQPQSQPQPSQSFVRPNNKLSQTGKRGNKDHWLSYGWFYYAWEPPRPVKYISRFASTFDISNRHVCINNLYIIIYNASCKL